MKRTERFPDTDTFVYFNANPKNRITGDCAFRAISTAMNQDYKETIMEMASMACETGYAINDPKGIEKYLKSKGWIKHSQPRKDDNTKYTGDEWCKHISINKFKGNIIANIGSHHIACIKPTYSGSGFNDRYKIHDIWNCGYRCVGNYWTKGA